MPPKISLVILTANRQPLLTRCLTSVARQTIQADEVIVVDGSAEPNNTKRVLEKFKHIVPVRHIRETRRSIPYARNLGVKKSHGDIIVFLDDDLAASPDYLSRMRERLMQNDAGAVMGKIENSTPKNIYAATQYAYYERGLRRAFGDITKPRPVTWGRMLDLEISGFKKTTLDTFGFPKRPHGFRHDDVELGIRIIRKKKRILFDPAVTARSIPRTHLLPLLVMIFSDGYWNAFIEKIYRTNLRNAPHPLPFLPWWYTTIRQSPFTFTERIGFGMLLIAYPVISRMGAGWYALTQP